MACLRPPNAGGTRSPSPAATTLRPVTQDRQVSRYGEPPPGDQFGMYPAIEIPCTPFLFVQLSGIVRPRLKTRFGLRHTALICSPQRRILARQRVETAVRVKPIWLVLRSPSSWTMVTVHSADPPAHAKSRTSRLIGGRSVHGVVRRLSSRRVSYALESGVLRTHRYTPTRAHATPTMTMAVLITPEMSSRNGKAREAANVRNAMSNKTVAARRCGFMDAIGACRVDQTSWPRTRRHPCAPCGTSARWAVISSVRRAATTPVTDRDQLSPRREH